MNNKKYKSGSFQNVQAQNSWDQFPHEFERGRQIRRGFATGSSAFDMMGEARMRSVFDRVFICHRVSHECQVEEHESSWGHELYAYDTSVVVMRSHYFLILHVRDVSRLCD